MKDKLSQKKLSIFRICPDCKQDILTHPEVKEEIKIHGEQIKSEIETKKANLPKELFHQYIKDEIIKFSNLITKWERIILNPLNNPNKNAYASLESWRNIINIYNTELSSRTSNRSSKLSFQWKGNIKEIKVLYDRLINDDFINSNTSYTNFKKIFTGHPLNSITPVKWNNTKSLLAYLITQLHNSGKFPFDTEYWSIAESCFKDIKNLKQLAYNSSNTNTNNKPRGYKSIDALLANL